MHYYTFHIGDYRRDTQHLSLLEHGIYRQLIDAYYLNEGSLEADLENLMRTHCIRTADEVRAFENVLKDFFDHVDGRFIHKGCDKVIKNFHDKSNKAKASAKVRWDQSDANAMRTHSERIANAMQSDSERNANGMLPITHNPIPKTHKPNQEFVLQFDQFWNTYPKKQAKQSALKAFQKLKPTDDLLQTMIQAIEVQKRSDQWSKENGKFIPHPATWLNDQRWLDELSAPTQQKRIAVDL